MITMLTPTFTNRCGPSSLPYYLVKGKPSDMEVIIYSFNSNGISEVENNKISEDLNCKIQFINENDDWRYKFSKRKLISKFFNLLYPYPSKSYQHLSSCIVNEIESYKPDAIWIYPYFYISISKQLSRYKQIVTGPDSLSLHYKRSLEDDYIKSDESLKSIYYRAYRKSRNLENLWAKREYVTLHLVGMNDLKYYQSFGGNNAVYLPHPHYHVPNYSTSILLSNDKLKIAITGAFDIYTNSDVTKWIKAMKTAQLDKSKIKFTFLGKDWKSATIELKDFGFDCDCKEWVDDYYDEISQNNVQLFPISVGTGTKGKVLDALCCGILCIGSKYAFENIAVKDNVSCIQYISAAEIPNILQNIIETPDKYKCYGENGRISILANHSPKDISNIFFKLFLR